MAVLIFEKSVEITERLIGLIEEAGTGMEIYHTDSYRETVSLLHQKDICAVLLDLNLGEKEPVRLIELAKRKEPGTLVVVVYTHADDKSLELYKSNGADFLLDKHNDFGRIPILMNQALEIKKARANKSNE